MTLQIDNLHYIGQVAVFYIPAHKLDNEKWSLPSLTKGYQTPRAVLHEFLIEHYDAYTVEISNTQGFWRKKSTSKLFHDQNARYEVSFGGREKIPEFVAFLAKMCRALHEEAIYLTMGRHSYLVTPPPE